MTPDRKLLLALAKPRTLYQLMAQTKLGGWELRLLAARLRREGVPIVETVDQGTTIYSLEQ